MVRMSIEPIDPPDDTELREMLAHAGVPAQAAEHLVPALLEPGFYRLGLGDDVEDGDKVRQYLNEVVRGVGGIFAGYLNWEPAFVHVVLCFLGALPSPWWLHHRFGMTTPLSDFISVMGDEPAPEWLGRLLDVDIPRAAGLVTVYRMTGGKLNAEVLLRQWSTRPAGYPAWDAALDWDVEEKGLGCWRPADKTDPSQPWFWLRNAPMEAKQGGHLKHQMFQDHAVAFVERTREVDGLRESLAIAMTLRAAAHETAWRRTSEAIVRSRNETWPLQPLREVLMQELTGMRVRALAEGASPAAMRAWLEAASWIATRVAGEPPLLGPEQQGYTAEVQALVAAAGRVLGQARQQLRAGEEVDVPLSISALRVMRWLEGSAMALRHVQQLMASAAAPCTGDDLRYYVEEGSLPPPALSWIPQAAAWIVNTMMADEREDPSLEAARVDFAAFLLRRLKSREGGNAKALEPLEQRPEWRFGIIRAIEDLQANPEGTGHHVLYRVSQEDPDEDVRRIAAKVYEKVRHTRGGEKQVTPRVKFLRAFWWLRYAQRAALEEKVDEPRARSVRSKEVSRTQAVHWL